jgi:hypothetical protein
MTTPQPEQLAADLHSFYVEQSDLSDKFIELEITKTQYFNAHRPEHKSDSATERAFYTTTTGLEYIRADLRLKDLSRRISALKTLLRNAENVAHGTY